MKKLFSLLLVAMLISVFYVPQVAGESDKVLITMQIGNKTAYINGEPFAMDAAPAIVPPGRTVVPIRFVAEGFSANVQWNGATKTVTMTMDSIPYLNDQITTLEGENSNLTTKNGMLQDQVTTLDGEKTVLATKNGALQERVTQLEKDKADLNSQNSVLQQKIEELQKGSSGNTATQIAAQNNQFIVYIENKDDTNTAKSSGSGFIASTDGKVVTNYHVIKDASTVSVKLNDGRIFTLNSVVNYDEARDIAILQLPLYNIQTASLGDSSKIANGDDVVVIGNPLGLENSVTTGVISATSRVINNQVWVQFSAPVSPGSSGGPVFNSNGEVVGVVASKVVGEEVEGINFAVPINNVKTLLSYNKPTTFSELFGTGTNKSKSWTLAQDEIQSAINFGKSTKDDLAKFFEPFGFGLQTGWQTNGNVETPYFWIALIARDNTIKGKDTTNKDVQDTLSWCSDKLSFMVSVYGNSIDFAKNYSARIIVNGKTFYPTLTDNTDTATMTLIYPNNPAYSAMNTYYFNNSDIPRDAIVTLVIDNGYGKTESFVIDLSKIP